MPEYVEKHTKWIAIVKNVFPKAKRYGSRLVVTPSPMKVDAAEQYARDNVCSQDGILLFLPADQWVEDFMVK